MVMKKFLRFIDKIFVPRIAYAHCDIPCGIYDPHEAQMAAHTVLRMTQMINELNIDSVKGLGSKNIIHQLSRMQRVKEDHAEIVKHQIRVIWGDYFKSEHLDKYKDLNELVFKIMKTASLVKQDINETASNELIKLTQDFAEIFWTIKDKKTKRVASGYPTEGDIVVPA